MQKSLCTNTNNIGEIYIYSKKSERGLRTSQHIQSPPSHPLSVGQFPHTTQMQKSSCTNTNSNSMYIGKMEVYIATSCLPPLLEFHVVVLGCEDQEFHVVVLGSADQDVFTILDMMASLCKSSSRSKICTTLVFTPAYCPNVHDSVKPP